MTRNIGYIMIRFSGFILLFLCLNITLVSQILTPYHPTITFGDKPLEMPFIGGLSAPQFLSIDLNRDGKKDVLIFERNGNVLIPMLNEGKEKEIKYVYAPATIKNFPIITNWVFVADYNNDGIEDLFKFPQESSISGIEVWKGKIQNGLLGFDKWKNISYEADVITATVGNQTLPIYMSFIDYPSIVDVDGDGDLDILTFESGGSYLEYYRNQSVEQNASLESLRFSLEDRCFGKFYEDQFSDKITLSPNPEVCSQGTGIVPDENRGKGQQRHTGSSITAIDPDCDGDLDLLIGDIGSERLKFLRNAGTKSKAWFNSIDTRFPSEGESVNIYIFNNAFSIDVNNDGLRDLIVTVNETSNSKNTDFIWYYENTGIMCNPKYTLKSKSLFVDQMIDIGNSAHPMFFDYNNDGLQDIIVGTSGNVLDGFVRQNKISLFQNTGTRNKPSFSYVTDNFLEITKETSLYTRLAPTKGDLDGDGDLDLLFGHSQGSFLYVENRKQGASQSLYSPITKDWKDIFVGQNASPVLYDFDGDGLLDLISGKQNNQLNFYRNKGSRSNPAFNDIVPDEANLGQLFSGNDFPRQNGSPEIFKIKDQAYLLMGFNDGRITLYSINNNDPKSRFTQLKLNLLPEHIGRQSNPAIEDIDNDGFFEILVGNERGGLNFYKTNISTTNTLTSNPQVKKEDAYLYPNPISGNLININGLDKQHEFIIHDLLGRQLLNGKIDIEGQILLPKLPQGSYVLSLFGAAKPIRITFVVGI
jgi:hypothetical protein